MLLSVKLFLLLASCAFGLPLARDPNHVEFHIDPKKFFIVFGSIVEGTGVILAIIGCVVVAYYDKKRNLLRGREMAMAPMPVIMAKEDDDLIINIDEEEDELKKEKYDVNAFEVNGIDPQLESCGSDEDYYHVDVNAVDGEDAFKVVDKSDAENDDHQLNERNDPANAEMDILDEAVHKMKPNFDDK